jgi:uncharacterized membrane protein YfcA
MDISLLGALLVGLSLGLMGSGGSILTVPVLVYMVGEPDKLAIAESLGIVAFISLAGAIPFAIKKMVDWRSVFLFGVPGMIGTYGGAWLANYVSGTFQLLLFAVVMIVAAFMMFRGGSTEVAEEMEEEAEAKPHAWWKIVGEGLFVGVMTGLVGVGGGFLIVPALVLLGGLSMHLAIGTSLFIIAMKSFSGFYKYIDVLEKFDLSVNWQLVAIFSVVGVVGSFVGRAIGKRISQEGLRKAFAVFLVIMGGYIIFMNV